MASTEGRIVPETPHPDHDGKEALDAWGFADSGFRITEEGHVSMAGSRYPLSGAVLPRLIPWMSGIIEIDVDPFDVHEPRYPPSVPEPVENIDLMHELNTILSADQIDSSDEVRLRHGHGHTQEDMWAIRYGSIARVPDLVVYPKDEDEAQQLVRAAVAHGAVIIPYGGGTNVSEALRCPADEARTIVSVDLKRMHRIRWIDPRNRTACIEAGARGRHIEEALAPYGYSIGHEPDSIEFSTLGGWIATNASGMKKNRYGNIEDIVLDVQAVTSDGRLERMCVGPRESVGIDPRQLLFGSEGEVALITSAVVTLFPLPEEQTFDSFLFHSFGEGVSFVEELTRHGNVPASVRLVDNLQFQLSRTLKPERTGVAALVSRLQKRLVTGVYGYDPNSMVALTLVYEGTRREVREQRRTVKRIAKRHRGFQSGAENGKRGYAMTFAIAYIRDFVMRHYVLAESFETSVSWTDVRALFERVKQRVFDEHAARNLPGKPFITGRVTQVYPTGVCVYFYLAIYYKGVDNPSETFSQLERAARDEILNAGGTLSHHHGIGKIRESFVDRIHSPASRTTINRLVSAFDPHGVFGVSNQGIGARRKPSP
ncbi:MAG: FAD-binding oxidoreductase [Spirochaetales bacterium]